MRLLKANIDLLAPFLSHLFCWSLQHSVVLSLMKSAYIMPIIKKADMDSMCPKSYPISHLSVLSKLLECLVSEQFVKYLTDSRLLPGWQSAYRRFHSTETAVLGVYSDILTALDSGNLAMLSSLGSRRIWPAVLNVSDHQHPVPNHQRFCMECLTGLSWYQPFSCYTPLMFYNWWNLISWFHMRMLMILKFIVFACQTSVLSRNACPSVLMMWYSAWWPTGYKLTLPRRRYCGVPQLIVSIRSQVIQYVLATLLGYQCPSSVTLGSTLTLTWVWEPTSLQLSGPVLWRCDRSVVCAVHWRWMLCWLCSMHWSSSSLTSVVQHWLLCVEHCCRDYSLCWMPPLDYCTRQGDRSTQLLFSGNSTG